MKFDNVILTASNARQAKGYGEVLKRIGASLAPRCSAVPDPGGRRVGSLLATVNALKGCNPKRELVLVCHSGGDSKRLPSYAAVGKAFVPVPCEGGARHTLLERIVRNMERLKLPRRGVLVVCGDVAPEFDFSKCTFAPEGVTGVAFRGTPEQGSRHGVYVLDGRRVTGFLQKPSPDAARKAGAIVRGKEFVDTGIMWIGPWTAARMVERYSRFLGARSTASLDLYSDFTADLLAGLAPFEANVADRCDFFHVGSTAELLEKLGRGREWVDACSLPRSMMKLGGRNVVTFMPKEHGPLELAEGECITGVKLVSGGWKYVKYRVEDSFKTDGLWEKFKMGSLMERADRRAMLRLSDEASVSLPLRIDLAGGWSDTPPICNDMGGAVLNAAVTLFGAEPVSARVRRIAAREVRVHSVDLRRHAVITSRSAIYSKKDPHDWCALVKSALAVSKYEFSEGGLDISIKADVPKGSGMGTSSLLGAALLSALAQARGRDASVDAIGAAVLDLEREMGTGGGWQDQFGGLVPGVKLVTSSPGKVQRPRVRRLDAESEARFAKWLGERGLLYFTGQKRMARNILKGVVDFYRDNPCSVAVDAVRELKKGAHAAFAALERGDFDAFAEAVNGYWRLKKALDPGSTSATVEAVISRLAPMSAAALLCGAGGGGFMFIVARSPEMRLKIRRFLEARPIFSGGRFFDFGLKTLPLGGDS